MGATHRSEGFRVLILGCALGLLGGSGVAVAAPGAPQKNVSATLFALPSDLPGGLQASAVAFNTGNENARLVIRPLVPRIGEEAAEIALGPGGTRALSGLDFLEPGRPIRLESSSSRVEVHLLVRDALGDLLESFPVDRKAARRQDFVLPIADENPACPEANPAEAAKKTRLVLVSSTPAPHELRLGALSASGQEVAAVRLGAALGAVTGVALADVFSADQLAQTRSVRVESRVSFAGYGLTEIGPRDVLGILPTITSPLWITEPPHGWNEKEHPTHLVLFNPQEFAVKVKVGRQSVELPPRATRVLPWPGAFTRMTSERPVSLFLAYGQAAGCGVSGQVACWEDRPWSVPSLLGGQDVLVALGPLLPPE